MNDDQFIVICRDAERVREHWEFPYTLATRRVFSTKDEAEAYATTVNASRVPLVVSGRFNQLRFNDI